ncbi:MAG TPA: class II aldolase/adducin family protein [Tepidisphaeraceae bacterium]|jgi:rhamnose utilization protein RhaD (predicted bifunctional aldolase and dehydrogenase)
MDELVNTSHRYGGDPAYVLAGGGNTSVKTPDRLWVKASGHALADIGPNGFVELDRHALQAMLEATWPADAAAREAQFIASVMAARIQPELGQRPSVEALLHHILPGKLVVHTHPGKINALTCSTQGRLLAQSLFGDDVMWQPYVDPGLTLAKSLSDSLADHAARVGRPPKAILLANHGLIVSGESAAAIAEISDELMSRIEARLVESPLSYAPPASSAGLLSSYADAFAALRNELHCVTDASAPILNLLASPAVRDAALAGPLTPDQIVYCRSIPLWIDATSNDPAAQCRELWEAYVTRTGFEPWVALIGGAGMVTMRESQKLAEVTRSIFADAASVYRDAARLGGIAVMSDRDRSFIEGWEVEAYRRSVMSRSSAATTH